ncbi:polyketide cyclase [Lysinibacillus xylanilyticus]|uniref:Polyketide cyclase n=1 Tax=Lysinibacillus xylanilyticus TaxID=582475 RepID=A0A0K9FD56_9BACI|nr:ester cyclase [Lysinibacillus xylanilyticus]KMY32410.1 polyketide cyclase [Lysinibacillus xylanilyticus]
MTPEQIVKKFFEEVRSGNNPDYATELMADRVLAHQVISEEESTVLRTPTDYADHVKEMVEAYGDFSLEIQEFMVQVNKVYVRWKQLGTHVGEVDGFQPTSLPVIEIASAVYRIEEEKIVEYWIQIDRAGIEKQLNRNKIN